jgi:hypothetical protein
VNRGSDDVECVLISTAGSIQLFGQRSGMLPDFPAVAVIATDDANLDNLAVYVVGQ